MLHTKTSLLLPAGVTRLAGLFMALLFASVAYAQKRDTVPARRVIAPVNLTKKVSTPVRDTVPAKRVTAPVNVINKVITQPKDTTKPRVITDANVRPGVIDKIGILTKYPDTLDIGEYLVVVEAYDKGGEWVNAEMSYKKLNGIGRVKFKCPTTYTVWPGLWKNAVLKPVRYTVVSNMATKENEISARDAASLGLKTQPGEEVELEMPIINGKALEISKYITDIKGVKTPEGIRVRFTDITVKVLKAGASYGQVLAGIAKYPTDPAIPAVPFTLNISPGFALEVSAVTFQPGQNALVTAKLLLPASIAQNSACARGSLDLGNFRLSPTCEFYKELNGQNYGVFGIGNTTLAIEGRGYVADFSSSQSFGPSGKPATWKGVVLLQGESKGTPAGTVVSNIGYMQAEYNFTNGIVESSGLTATFRNTNNYGYGAAQPYGYLIEFGNAKATVNVAASKVNGGSIMQAKIILPKTAVRQANDAEVVLTDANITIKNSMDLIGYAAVAADQTIYWGDLIAAGGGDRKSFGVEKMNQMAWLYFSAQAAAPFNPTSANGKKFQVPFGLVNAGVVETYKMQGATFGNFGLLVVNTPNVPGSWDPNQPRIPSTDNQVWFRLSNKDTCWMNVVTEGVHCNIKGDIMESPGLKLGDPAKPLYVGVVPFETLTMNPDRKNAIKPFSSILVQCVESAVINCDFQSHLKLPEPVGDVLSFKEMVFTSTSNNAGGKLALKPGDSLAYWGLQLVPKPGFNDAGLVSVKTGQIILTAAGLAETRHFAQPFWLTWGEMLANGSMGRLFFDYNSAGQQFDKFNFTHNAVALSPIDPDPAKKGFLRVGGTAYFPFFGGDYLHIIDTYTPGMAGDPFNGRTVTLSNAAMGSFLPSDLTIGGNWSDGLGIFQFTIQYASASQDGFIGTGTSALRYLMGGDIGSTLDMNSRGTCIRIGTNLMDQRSISLGPVANISRITRIWGCLCVKNDSFENLVIGGEVTDAANVSVAARVGSYLSAILQITPSLARITIDGEAYMSLALSLDAMVSGHMQMTMNWAQGFLEGEVMGKFRVAEGSLALSGSSLQAEGQLNWHVGVDFNELQGMVALRMMSSTGVAGLGGGLGGGMGVGAAFYIGMNAPKERAWVLLGADPRYALNMAPMPSRLSGIYGSLQVSQSVSLFVISGGYEIHVGLGAFTLTPASATLLGALAAGPGLPYIVGNLGGRIHGEILGGLVSAAAWFNLQLMGPYPFSFQGTVGLEACVLWVFCGSVDLTIGLNTSEGFYIR